jgi:hypothetical protein
MLWPRRAVARSTRRGPADLPDPVVFVVLSAVSRPAPSAPGPLWSFCDTPREGPATPSLPRSGCESSSVVMPVRFVCAHRAIPSSRSEAHPGRALFLHAGISQWDLKGPLAGLSRRCSSPGAGESRARAKGVFRPYPHIHQKTGPVVCDWYGAGSTRRYFPQGSRPAPGAAGYVGMNPRIPDPGRPRDTGAGPGTFCIILT